jgi:hypothetical protein
MYSCSFQDVSLATPMDTTTTSLRSLLVFVAGPQAVICALQ